MMPFGASYHHFGPNPANFNDQRAKALADAQAARKDLEQLANCIGHVVEIAVPNLDAAAAGELRATLSRVWTRTICSQIEMLEQVPDQRPSPEAIEYLQEVTERRDQLRAVVERIDAWVEANGAKMAEKDSTVAEFFQLVAPVLLDPMRSNLASLERECAALQANIDANLPDAKHDPNSEGEPLYPPIQPTAEQIEAMGAALEKEEHRYAEPCPFCQSTDPAHLITQCEQRPADA